MADAVLFDTNVLPVSRNLRTPLWQTIRKLCQAAGVRVVLPEIVVAESANLRRARLSPATDAFVKSMRGLAKLVELEPVYVPDVDSICEEWESELRDAFDVVEVHGDDAASALTREARRVRPAREGRGGRDSAIWLTVLRLATSHDHVIFVSNNTKDFAHKGEGLHPDLEDECAKAGATVSFVTSLEQMISLIAPPAIEPTLEPGTFAEMLRFEIADAVAAEIASVDGSGSKRIDVLADSLEVGLYNILRSVDLEGEGLALVQGSAEIATSFDAQITFGFRAWVSFDVATSQVLSGEIDSVSIDARAYPQQNEG